MSKRRAADHLASDLPSIKRPALSPSPASAHQLRSQAEGSTSTFDAATNSPTATAAPYMSFEVKNISRHNECDLSSSLLSDIDDRGRSLTRTGNDGPKCFRIANVPPDWKKDTLLAALETIDPCLEDHNPQLSLYPCLDSTQTQTALLNLGTCTTYFHGLKPNDFNHVHTTDNNILVIDSHFYGLTPLNSPEGKIVAELVALNLLELWF
jgi:hypothetical protein